MLYMSTVKKTKWSERCDLELEFLHNHNATVLKSQNGHLDTVYEKMGEGILKMTDTLN